MKWKRNPCGAFAKSAQAHSFAEYINITVCGADRFTIAINIKVLVHLGNFPVKKKKRTNRSLASFCSWYRCIKNFKKIHILNNNSASITI